MPHARRFLPLFAAALLALTACRSEPPPAAPPQKAAASGQRPNILLISVDSLRADHLSCYGYARPSSPNIDRLAQSGALFEQMISSSAWTLPAHTSMFTGLAESVHGVIDPKHRLPDATPTVAEILHAAGYQTAGFFSGPFLHPVFGLGRGFEQYVDCSSYAARSAATASQAGTLDDKGIDDASHQDITSPRVYEHVRQFLESPHPAPFFLFVHWWDVHYDYIPPPPYDRKFDPDYKGSITGVNFFDNPAVNARMPKRDLEHLVALYDGEIAWTDAHIGKLLDDLDRLKLSDNTLIILTADHGTGFFEHMVKGHRNSLFEEVIRIPLIVRWPGAAPRRIHPQARMIDLAPTLLEFAGLSAPRPMMGRSLRAQVISGATPADEPALTELLCYGFEGRCTRFAGRKYIAELTHKMTAVFDLNTDPTEHREVTDRNSAVYRAALQDFQRVSKWLADWKQRLAGAQSQAAPPPDVLRSLKTFGYVGEDEPQSQPASAPTSRP